MSQLTKNTSIQLYISILIVFVTCYFYILREIILTFKQNKLYSHLINILNLIIWLELQTTGFMISFLIIIFAYYKKSKKNCNYLL